MIRLICGLILVLLVASPSFGQQSLVGTYKMVSQTLMVDGVSSDPMGKAPKGYLLLTPTRAVFFFTAENRKFGTSATEKVGLFETLVAWSGAYRVEANKLIIKVDASWVESWNGKEQVRNWELSGNRLILSQDSMPYPRDPSKMANVRQVWEKVE
jgi:hypothetical protein